MLAGVFIAGGLDALRNPEPRAETAAPVIDTMTSRLPASTAPDRVTMVQANAAVQVAAASALVLGFLPRLAALALVGSIVPTTLGGPRFWEHADPRARGKQRTQFLKNAAILGGLLVVALD